MLVDLSHEIYDGLDTYPGLPKPIIQDWMNREDSRGHYDGDTEFHIGRIDMVANTGTYLDTPFHRYADGVDLAGIPLGALAGLPGLVIQVPPNTRCIKPKVLQGKLLAGRAVLFHTGWSQHFGTPTYADGHPYLATETAAVLIAQGAILVGIDSLNVDQTEGPSRPIHTSLLNAGIPIVEHLRGLEELPEERFSFFAVPPKVRGLGSFPVRAFALLDKL